MSENDPESAAQAAQRFTPSAEAFDPQDAILQKIDEMDSMENATFRVYRQNEGNSSKMDFLFTVPVDKYTVFDDLLSYIRDNYGGGDYRIHLRGPTDTGSNQLITNKLFSIAEPKKAESQQRNEMTSVVESMMGELRAMREEMNRAYTERANQPQQASQNPMDMMKSMVEMMTMMHGMMPQPNQIQPKTLAEQMKELKEMREFAEEFGGDGKSDGFSSLVKDGLKPMMDLIQQETKMRQEARQRGVEYQPPKQNPDQKGTAEVNPSELDEGTKAMLGNVKTLIIAAQRGGDPETYADMVLDFLPQEKYMELYNFLIIPDCMDTIIHHVPEVGNHREWFEKLRVGILESLAPDGDDGDNGGHADGQDDQIAGHGDDAGTPAGEGRGAGDVADDGKDRSGRENASTDS